LKSEPHRLEKGTIKIDTLEQDKFYETFNKIDRKHTKVQIEFLRQSLSKHLLFSQFVNDNSIMEDVF
jgi:hypothetical protein